MGKEAWNRGLQKHLQAQGGKIQAGAGRENERNQLNLKHCPFCGLTAEMIHGAACYAVCQSCGAFGPNGDDNKQAAERWNYRQSQTPSKETKPMNTPKTRTPSATLLEVEVALRDRERKGVETYGQTVDRTDMGALEWATEGLNEALDGALYAMRTIKAIEAMAARARLMRDALREIAETDPTSQTDMRRIAKAALEQLRGGDQ